MIANSHPAHHKTMIITSNIISVHYFKKGTQLMGALLYIQLVSSGTLQRGRAAQRIS